MPIASEQYAKRQRYISEKYGDSFAFLRMQRYNREYYEKNKERITKEEATSVNNRACLILVAETKTVRGWRSVWRRSIVFALVSLTQHQ
eukprot:g3361.t1